MAEPPPFPPPPPAQDLALPERLRAMRRITMTQLFGVVGMDSFTNGILLLYMTVLGITPARILVYLALPNGLSMLLRLPVAYLADRFGKKRLGQAGTLLAGVGYSALPLAGFLYPEDASACETLILGGIALHAMGKMLFAASWVALASEVVPAEMRGRYFGQQRLFYQVVSIAFAGVCSWLLAKDSPIELFLGILIVLTLCFFVRSFLYRGVLEMDAPPPGQTGFWTALGVIVRAPGYTSFCAYVFLLTLFTAGCGNLFAMVEKHVMQLSGGQVVLLANLGMIGGILGFYAGGRFIDRLGTKYVFLVCHFAFGGGILAFLGRDMTAVPAVWIAGAVHLLLGIVGAASSIAITTETLALIPEENKSLSTSVCTSLVLGGSSLAGLASAWALSLGMLRDSWTLWGTPLSQYDAILMLCGGMIILMVVTLGLVPSVLRKAEWIPRGQ